VDDVHPLNIDIDIDIYLLRVGKHDKDVAMLRLYINIHPQTVIKFLVIFLLTTEQLLRVILLIFPLADVLF